MCPQWRPCHVKAYHQRVELNEVDQLFKLCAQSSRHSVNTSLFVEQESARILHESPTGIFNISLHRDKFLLQSLARDEMKWHPFLVHQLRMF